ncbi:MAG: hypothetical protein IPF54_02820 [Draconibacterium sp.]|nr:hypothetical protein [Draconibacterium sp.]
MWIKKSQVDVFEPKVFQIDMDKTTLVGFESVQTENSPLTAFMLVVGLGSIAFTFGPNYLTNSRKFWVLKIDM